MTIIQDIMNKLLISEFFFCKMEMKYIFLLDLSLSYNLLARLCLDNVRACRGQLAQAPYILCQCLGFEVKEQNKRKLKRNLLARTLLCDSYYMSYHYGGSKKNSVNLGGGGSKT